MRLGLRILAMALVLGFGGWTMAAAPAATPAPSAPAAAPTASKSPAATSPTASTAQADYEIRLSQRTKSKVGEEYRMAMVAEESMKETDSAEGKVYFEDVKKTSVDFEMSVKVLELDKDGELSKISMTVDKCMVKKETEEKSPLARGTVVIRTTKDKEDVFEIDGKPVIPEAAEVLKWAAGSSKDSPNDEDDCWGAKDRKKVGDRWAIDAEASARVFTRHGFPCSPKEVAGTVTLAGVLKVEGVDCLDIQGEVTISRFNPPPHMKPKGYRVEKAMLVLRYDLKVPVDVTKPVVGDISNWIITDILKPDPKRDGPETTSVMVQTAKETRRYTYPK